MPTDWITEGLNWLVATTQAMGYTGLLVMTMVDATIIPFPIEATLIPVGYLVAQGKMAFVPSVLVSVGGTLLGSCVNYWLASHLGRPLILRYGRYLRITDEKMQTLEKFFARHGAISVFCGRLLPGMRHYIAIPAGLARMRMSSFLFYSALGSLILAPMLIGLGYVIGVSEAAAKHYVPMLKFGLVIVVLIGIALYIRRHYRQKSSSV